MKRFLLLVTLAIGLLVSSVATAKGHETGYVSVSENSDAFGDYFISSANDYTYLASASSEVIVEYADEVILPELDGFTRGVFYPPDSEAIFSYSNIYHIL